jgi:hypothetical protein
MEAISGSGFWGSSKPYCSFCGWNLQAAKELEKAFLRELPKTLLLFAAFFGVIGYLFRSGFALVPLLFLSVFIVASAIVSWRKLEQLETSHPAALYTGSLTSSMAANESMRRVRTNANQYLWGLSKPRRVRLKPVPLVISIAFPLSWIFIAFFGYQTVRDQLAASRPLTTLSNLGALLFFALIWSVIGITTIRGARKDRDLLAEGNLALAIVTRQEVVGRKHRQSKIRYEFRDAAGQQVEGEGTDDSWQLYEDMEVPVFYDSENPKRNVALPAASYKLRNA